jgi:signal transduction histidine kinase
MTLQAIFYWLSVFGIILVGVLVILRLRKPVFIYYSIFSFLLAAWLMCQYYIRPGNGIELFLSLSFIFVELLVSVFLLFAYSYPNKQTLPVRYWYILPIPIILFGPFSFNHIIASASLSASGSLVITAGPLYYLQNGIVLIYLIVASVVLINKYKQSIGIAKQQLKLILIGLTQFLVANILAGLVFVNSSQAQALRPISAFIMISIIGYTIAFKGLFDIRLVVVRALAYALTITSLGLVYGLLVFGLVGQLFFKNKTFDFQEQLVYTVLAVALAFTFQRIQNFFNRLTNRLFFRDSYEPQILLDKLSRSFAEEINFSKLAIRTTNIIVDEMKIYFSILLVIDGSNGFRPTSYGKSPDIALLTPDLLTKIKRKVTIVDDIKLGDSNSKLQSELNKLDIAAILRLVNRDGLAGYLILGRKHSGRVFNNQDTETLNIIGNSLVVAVQNTLSFEEIQQFNITLQDKVNEATAKLRKANDKLKALDETKDDFISMASHQLRTPLTSVKGYLSMVLEGDAGKINKVQKEMLGQAFFSSQRMVYLISEVVQQELSQLEETAASRSLKLVYEKPKDFPVVMLDETKTRQVIMNFTDNAIYYTPSGGTIKVRLINNPETIELRVEDDGIGVPKSEQHHLFSKFYRAGNARKARPDGTGLGLFMAKKVILAEGGSVIFESEEGKGSTFGFIFSKSKVALPAKDN